MLERRHSKLITAADVKDILKKHNILKQGKTPGRNDLRSLAWRLDEIRGAFEFATMIANGSHETAYRVRNALAVLMMFFEERDRACRLEKPDPRAIETERHLRDQFWRFVLAMAAHNFELDMDAGTLMPRLENWRDLAEVVAGAFMATMARANGGRELGISNDGPVGRFVAAVVPLITGEKKPTPASVAAHIKRRRRKK
jgi:hypothetical protein